MDYSGAQVKAFSFVYRTFLGEIVGRMCPGAVGWDFNY
jgi:hypothetical protein